MAFGIRGLLWYGRVRESLSAFILPKELCAPSPFTTTRGAQGARKDAVRMAGTRIPDAIKPQIAGRITAFNRAVVQDPDVYYQLRYRGAFLHLDRCDYR
jgi:hypothetical protein